MKLVVLFTFLVGFSVAQAQNSYYFSEAIPSNGSKITQVDKSLFGTYYNSDKGTSYEVSEEGIFFISITYSSISKETIRESSTYDVRNGFLFGVLENDSVPCILEKGRYYFGIRNKQQIVGKGSENELKKISSSEFVLNYKENGMFFPAVIQFSGKELIFKEFNYNGSDDEFSFIEKQQTLQNEGVKLTLLSPDEEDFSKLKTEFFVSSLKFKRK